MKKEVRKVVYAGELGLESYYLQGTTHAFPGSVVCFAMISVRIIALCTGVIFCYLIRVIIMPVFSLVRRRLLIVVLISASRLC